MKILEECKGCKDCKFFRTYEGGGYYCKRDPMNLEEIPKFQIHDPCLFYVPEKDPTQFVRIESDLDSIEVSSSPRRKMKLYFNTRSDTKEEVEARIKQAAQYVILAEEALKGGIPVEVREGD